MQFPRHSQLSRARHTHPRAPCRPSPAGEGPHRRMGGSAHLTPAPRRLASWLRILSGRGGFGAFKRCCCGLIALLVAPQPRNTGRCVVPLPTSFVWPLEDLNPGSFTPRASLAVAANPPNSKENCSRNGPKVVRQPMVSRYVDGLESFIKRRRRCARPGGNFNAPANACSQLVSSRARPLSMTPCGLQAPAVLPFFRMTSALLTRAISMHHPHIVKSKTLFVVDSSRPWVPRRPNSQGRRKQGASTLKH